MLRYEQRASHLRAHGPISHTVAARVLGYLLLHPISPAGRERIAADVSYCCEVDARLYRLGMLFVKYFVHHCERAPAGGVDLIKGGWVLIGVQSGRKRSRHRSRIRRRPHGRSSWTTILRHVRGRTMYNTKLRCVSGYRSRE